MKSLFVTALLVLLSGCGFQEMLFQRDMRRYEETCDRCFSIYAASDMEAGKKALWQIIDLSLAERSKATRYWRFNLLIAYSQARLAVIAEEQGKKEEADRLFARASEYMVIQNRAFSQELRRAHVGFKEYSDDEARFTPDQWRKNVAALDKHAKVKWKEPNPESSVSP